MFSPGSQLSYATLILKIRSQIKELQPYLWGIFLYSYSIVQYSCSRGGVIWSLCRDLVPRDSPPHCSLTGLAEGEFLFSSSSYNSSAWPDTHRQKFDSLNRPSPLDWCLLKKSILMSTCIFSLYIFMLRHYNAKNENCNYMSLYYNYTKTYLTEMAVAPLFVNGFSILKLHMKAEIQG